MRTLLTTLLAVMILAPAGCVKNAATGETYLVPLGALGGKEARRGYAIQIGTEAAPQIAQEFGGAVQNAALQQYVRAIGQRLAAVTEADNPTLPWEFTLLDSGIINAFALPGGKVFITRGMCEKMSNEAQLAGVLGHEVAHVTAEHTLRQMGQAQAIGGGLAIGAVAVGAAGEDSKAGRAGALVLPALAIGGQLYMLKFGRDEESQADSLGMRYMSRIGYNPRGQLQVMEILREASGGSAGQIEFLSTHPLPETRIARVNSLLAKEFKSAAEDPKNQFYEERFQRDFLSALKRLPPPSQKAEAEVRRLIELARVSHQDH